MDLTNLKHGALLVPEADGSLAAVLSEDDLHVEEGQGAEHEHQEVGDQEGGAAMLLNKSINVDFSVCTEGDFKSICRAALYLYTVLFVKFYH